MLSLCFSFKAVGLYPSLLQYSPSNWNKSSFELLVIGREIFLCSSPGLWSVSGINVRVWHKGALLGGIEGLCPSSKWKGVHVCVLLQCWDFFPATLFPGESCWCRYGEIWGYHKNAQRKFVSSSWELWDTQRGGKERLPLEPGLLLEGSLGTQTGDLRSWWSFYSPTQGKWFLFLVWRPFCFHCSVALSPHSLHTKGRKCRMWAGCKITPPSPFSPRWNAD